MTDATVDLEAGGYAGDPRDTAAGAPPEQEQQGDPADLGEAGRRALQAERTARADAERQLREAQQTLTTQAARITELETGQGSLTSEVTDLRTENLRLSTAVDHGLGRDLAARLVGSTAEELAADAQSLLALMGAQKGTPAPRPDPSQGSRTPPAQSAQAQFKATLGSLLSQ
jgi:hypothetical protein